MVGLGVEGSSKKEKELINTVNSALIVEGRVEVEEDIRGINGNEKNTIKKSPCK